MRPLFGLRLSAVLMCFLTLPATAATDAYVSAWNTLYRLDLSTARATPIGSGIGYNDVEGLAIAPDGTLYGVADGSAGSGSQITDFLIRINTSSGIGTLVGPLEGLSGVGPNETGQLDYGLAFTCDGRLWASSDTTGLLWEIDPRNGQVREAGNTGAPISGLAGRGAQLFGIGVQNGFGNRSQQALYRITPDTAQAERIGSLGINDTLSSSGADFDAGGVLWATLDSQPPDVDRASRLARVDLASGTASVIGPISGILENVSVRGMAIAAPRACDSGGGTIDAPFIAQVPGPAMPALTLLGLLAAGIGARRLRR
ncbi:hypothetical protein OS187_09985 [Xanthomonadaceae bacterium JHOS43]|nr:hypothetical protein [Xanthomonadaceae bacterium JHOS43]MCX7564112.1 hypothetical protein [Xanthomonadaceae bacterium XH05]